jgi:peptidyl-Asp metalloendopeptidase
MRALVAVGLIGTLLLGCSVDKAQVGADDAATRASGVRTALRHASPALERGLSTVASVPDRGVFVAYQPTVQPRRQGADTWHAVVLSEEHALHAISRGGMVIPAPDGTPIRLAYERHIEHPDGTWTWIGRPAGAKVGTEAVLTFGANAVYGSIPYGNEPPLQLTTQGNRPWLIQTDPRLLAPAGMAAVASRPASLDVLPAPITSAPAGLSATSPAASRRISAAATRTATGATAVTTVDVVIGYTSGFANRLGGRSQAITRLQYLVDLANQAYLNSQVAGRIRMAAAVQVNYPDASGNQRTLFELSGVSCGTDNSSALRTPDTGVSCTPNDVPAALQPLIAARDRYGADLVSLVRNFTQPENGSCGVAWLLGATQAPIVASDARFGISVVSDSGGSAFPSQNSTCREEYLAHELGHNMGLQHDRQTAAGGDDTNGDNDLLDPEEYGRFPYSFGYSTANFYTIMSLRRTGQTGYRVFSNPNITSCGGVACGVADREDDVRALNQTMPIIAAFRDPHTRNDFNGDGISDVLWRNNSNGLNAIWTSANADAPQPISGVTNLAWKIVGAGDFDADGRSDILWRNASNGLNTIWKGGNSANQMAVARVSNLAWIAAGVGDVNADGVADIIWRNTSTGLDSVWLSGNSSTPQFMYGVTNQAWKIVGVGDFDGDGRSDVLWRNNSNGLNVIWKSADRATQQGVTTVGNLAWAVAGVGDFDGDGRSDILWRNNSTGLNAIWRSGNAATAQPIASVTNLAWKIVAVADYNGDGRADILWRNASTGVDVAWLSGDRNTQQGVRAVSNLSWVVVAG